MWLRQQNTYLSDMLWSVHGCLDISGFKSFPKQTFEVQRNRVFAVQGTCGLMTKASSSQKHIQAWVQEDTCRGIFSPFLGALIYANSPRIMIHQKEP